MIETWGGLSSISVYTCPNLTKERQYHIFTFLQFKMSVFFIFGISLQQKTPYDNMPILIHHRERFKLL